MTLEWKTYVWFLVWKCHDHIYLQFSKKLLFFCKMKGSLMKNAWISKFFPWLSFCLNQNHICTLCSNTFQSPFFSAVFWAPIFLVYQAISLCIKYIASVMIRCASAHCTHSHIAKVLFLLSITFPFFSIGEMVTNGIDLKSLLIFRSSIWDGNLDKVIPRSYKIQLIQVIWKCQKVILLKF